MAKSGSGDPLVDTEASNSEIAQIPAHPPFIHKLKGNSSLDDLFVISIIPVVLVVIFQLPLEIRRTLAFASEDPSMVTAFTANYVHFTADHLFGNVAWYLLIISLAYLLAITNEHRSRFFATLFAVLLVLPIPLSYLTLAVPSLGVSIGFSGLNMALFGFVVVEFSAYLDEYFIDQFGVENAPAFFFLVTTFVALPHAETRWGYAITFGSLFLVLVYSVAFLWSFRPSLSGLRDAVNKQGYVELSVSTFVVMVVFVPIAFPQNPIVEEGIINLYIHFVGFCLGFIGVYIAILLTTPAKPKRAVPAPPDFGCYRER